MAGKPILECADSSAQKGQTLMQFSRGAKVDKLLHSEHQLLHNWGEQVSILFNRESVYHVGSSLRKGSYRDVDVRVILDDKDFAKLEDMLDTEYLRLCISLWGQKVTGLPIDFDVQPRTHANQAYPEPRNCISIKHSAIYNSIKAMREPAPKQEVDKK